MENIENQHEKKQRLMLMARKRGLARAAALTPERRSEIARTAVNARWANREGKEAQISLMARKAGLVGGPARAAALTPERRSEIPRAAAKARREKRKELELQKQQA